MIESSSVGGEDLISQLNAETEETETSEVETSENDQDPSGENSDASAASRQSSGSTKRIANLRNERSYSRSPLGGIIDIQKSRLEHEEKRLVIEERIAKEKVEMKLELKRLELESQERIRKMELDRDEQVEKLRTFQQTQSNRLFEKLIETIQGKKNQNS